MRPRWWARWQVARRQYPPPIWVLMGGMFLSSAGTSMVWPFLALYVSARLEVPLTQVGLLITLQAAAGLVGTLLAGPLVDFVGRKIGMVLSLLGMAAGYLGLAYATTWTQFALFMALGGLFAPAYRIGGDAMIADLTRPEHRDGAYALMRTASNAGIALGPAVGGFLAVRSYQLAFYAAVASLLGYILLLLTRVPETRPQSRATTARPSTQTSTGYGYMLRDRRLLLFLLPALATWMAAGLIWIYLGVYMRDHHGLAEDKYGLLIATNAILVTLFQYSVTVATARWSPRWRMVVGSLLYAVATGGVVLAHTFWAFWVLMIVMTLGEMLLVPTASAWVANLAPPALRGRYMSTMAFMWGLAAGAIAPLGGWLNDHFSPTAPWLAGAGLGVLGALLFAWQRPPHPVPETPAPAPPAT